MNQEESICRPYEKNINCFEKTIPERFISSGKTKDYCSFKFPSGYSIYVEEFILKDAGPNNFILLDDKHLEYSPKLKWTDRRNNFWSKLEEGHPLRKKSDLRSNFRCIQSLKVKNIEEYINRESFLVTSYLSSIQKQQNLFLIFKFHRIAMMNSRERTNFISDRMTKFLLLFWFVFSNKNNSRKVLFSSRYLERLLTWHIYKYLRMNMTVLIRSVVLNEIK